MTSIDARLKETALLADALEGSTAELQEAAAWDAGFPIAITAMEVQLAIEHLRTMAEEIDWIAGREPYGTVAAIFPYDAPTVMLARLGGAALLTNNRLRFSFSSQTPRTAEVIARICKSIDTFEPVTGQDNREFGRLCVEDPSVRVHFISGASAVGEVYRRQRQSFDKLFFAGPGGMPATVVFADADPQLASRFIVRRAFINGGQYCTTIKKALIHKDLYPAVRDQILEQAAQIKVSDPFDLATQIGPIRVERTRLILQNALERLASARLLFGSIDGEWIRPLVLELENVEIPDLELFGPLLALQPFEDPSKTVQDVVKTRYGFLVAFFGTPSKTMRQQLYDNFGMVHDNPDFYFTPMRLPFGGKKKSGWILERSEEGWMERDGAFLYSKELVRSAK
jgi:acyl-CoA reductase-like NAD-dependent aldehyde dehydrogenase